MDELDLAPIVEGPPDEHAEPGPPEIEAVPIVGTGVFRAELDSTTGATTYVELTEDEVADAAAERAGVAAVRAGRVAALAMADAARDADVVLVQERAKTDREFAALARLAGIEIPEVQK